MMFVKKFSKAFGLVNIFFLFIFSITGCDNFLSGTTLQSELEAIIADSKAQNVTIDFSAADGFGDIYVNGASGKQFQIKEGKTFTLDFKIKDDYEFIKWKIETTDTLIVSADVTDDIPIADEPKDEEFDEEDKLRNTYLTIEEVESVSTIVKILKYAEGLKITPVCKVRPKIKEIRPENNINGVSRDRAISAIFTTNIPEENFYFEDYEIPAEATPLIDEEGNIWAYETEQEGRILKNIEIKNSDGESLANHFVKPIFDIETKTLKIEVNKDNPIQIEVGSTKMVYVTLKKEIKGENGSSLYENINWYYKATDETDEKAMITIKTTSAEGSAKNEGIALYYNILQKINLSFTENAEYQFVRWDYDKNIVNVIEPTNPNTIAQVINQTTDANKEEHPSYITAICAERLTVIKDKTSPKTEGKETVSRDSSIYIKFAKNLPVDEDGKKQLENISITTGGNTLKSSFKAPVVNGDTITFAADKENLIGINEGQTKIVTVTIPAEFYYELDDEYKTKVMMGGNGYTFDYKIDSSTIDKAEIAIVALEGSGSLSYTDAEKKLYSIGQIVHLKFEPNEGYQFNGWKISCGEEEVSKTDIEIADINKLETTLTVYSALSGVTVTADCATLLTVDYDKPETAIEKDSDIEFSFNNKPEITNEDLNKITILIDGMNAGSLYAKRSINGKTVTIKNTQRPSVEKGETKKVSVTIPKEFYYLNGTSKVYLENDYTIEFTINHTTKDKAIIDFDIINGESETYLPLLDAGKIIDADTEIECKKEEELNLDEVKKINFILNENYYFYGFKYLTSNGTDITREVLTVTGNESTSKEIMFKEKINGAKIYALCYKLPTVLSNGVEPFSKDEAETFEKNTPISIKFNHRVEDECKNKIRLSYTGGIISASEYFDITILNGTEIRLNPKMGVFFKLRDGHSYETVTVTVPSDIYYYDAVTGKKITMGTEDYVWSYNINNETISKTKINFQNNTNDSDAKLYVNNNVYTSATFYECSQDQIFNLKYEGTEGYRFSGWEINAPEPYIVEDGKVIYNGKTYFEIEDVNSSETSAISTIVIGNGITLSTGQYQIPLVTDITPLNSDEGCYFDTPIIINFNKAYKADTVTLTSNSTPGSINIFGGKNADIHIEKYFRIAKAGTAVTLTPIADITDLVENETDRYTIKVVLNANNLLIKERVMVGEEETEGYAFEGKTEHVYQINGNTTKKTKVTYASTNGSIKVNNITTSSGTDKEYVYSNTNSIKLESIPDDGYKFTEWKITVPSGYTKTETDGKLTVKQNDVVYCEVENLYNNSTEVYIKRQIEGGIGIEAGVIILPAAQFTPLYSQVGSYYSTDIEINFNKPMAPSSLTLTTLTEEGTVDIPGSINITDLNNENQHYENYFTIQLNSDNRVLKIKPKSTITQFVPTEKSLFDFRITLNKEGTNTVKDTEENSNVLTGTNSWVHRINGKTLEETTINFYVTNGTIEFNGIATGEGYETSVSYNNENSILLNCKPSSGYKFNSWWLESSDEYTIEESSNTLKLVKDDEVYFEIKDITQAATTFYSYKAIPETLTIKANTQIIPVVTKAYAGTNTANSIFLNTGYTYDTSLTFIFNRNINSSSVSLSKTGSINIVGLNNEENHFENYFNVAVSGTTITLKPMSNITDIFPAGTEIVDLKIMFNPNTGKQITDIDGSLVEGSLLWNYRINNSQEKNKPEFETIQLYKPNYVSGIGTVDKVLLKNNDYSSIIGTYYSTNHVNKKIFITCKGKDLETGIKNLTVKESLIRYVTGSANLVNPISAGNTIFNGSNNEINLNKYVYTLQSEMDGLIQLDFVLEDNAGNQTVSTWYVIKDTKIESNIVIPSKTFPSSSEVNCTDTNKLAAGKSIALNYHVLTNVDTDVKDSVSFTINSNTVNDIYIGSKKSNIYVDSVKWGYSKTSINNILTGSNGTYVLADSVRDKTKDTYVEFKVLDEVGNSCTLTRIIPGTQNIIDVVYDKANNKLHFTIAGYETRQVSLSSIEDASIFDYNLIYQYKPLSSGSYDTYRYTDSFNGLIKTYNGNFNLSNYNYKTPTDYRPYGFYKFYLIPYYKYNERYYWGTLSEGFEIKYDSTGVTLCNNNNTSSRALPNSLTLTMDPPVKNTGYYTLHFTWPSSVTMDSNYKYYLWYKTSADSDDYNYIQIPGTSQFSFNVPSGQTYYFGYFVTNQTWCKKSEILKTIACTSSDNIPPYVDCSSPELRHRVSYLPNYVRLNNSALFSTIPRDDDSGIKKVNSKNELSYYLIKNEIVTSSESIKPLAVTMDDLSHYHKYTIYYDSDAELIDLPYCGIDEGIYTVVLLMTDNSSLRNESIFAFSDYNYVTTMYKMTASIEAPGDSKYGAKLIISDDDNVSLIDKNLSYDYLDFKTNTWKTGATVYCPSGNGNSYTFNIPIYTDTNPHMKSFLRVNQNSMKSSKRYYYRTQYVYPEAVLKPSSYTVNSANMIEGVNGSFQILYNGPFFVHTICHSTDLGSDPSLWESRGVEVSIKSKSNYQTWMDGYTYTPDKTEMKKVLSSGYYVVIAHFTDGTTVMSEVKTY